MHRSLLEAQIAQRKSVLCVGLDPVLDRMPEGISRDAGGVFEFCRQIIDATLPYAVAYKPNLAFFECLGPLGMEAFAKTCDYIPDTHLVIADAKRGDIGNTAERYAQTFYDFYGCGAVTIAPHMGRDAVEPFFRKDRWAVVLALTSNPGAEDFLTAELKDSGPLWERIVGQTIAWAADAQLMFVMGATRPEQLRRMRQLAPDHFLLVPGVGAQGGSLEDVMREACIPGGGLLINASRSILYASAGADFAQAAAAEAQAMQSQMAGYL